MFAEKTIPKLVAVYSSYTSPCETWGLKIAVKK